MMTITRTVLGAAAVAAAVLAATTTARAEGPSDEAAAVALFEEAKKLVAGGDYARACPKFLEVKRTLPTAGLLLNLGDCLEKTGKLAGAWAEFKAAERAAQGKGDADRQGEGARRAQAIEGRALQADDHRRGAAERLPGLAVRRDGTEIGEGQLGSPVPVDGGEHLVEVSAPGYGTWSTKVAITAEGGAASRGDPAARTRGRHRHGRERRLQRARPHPGGARSGQPGAAIAGVGVARPRGGHSPGRDHTPEGERDRRAGAIATPT